MSRMIAVGNWLLEKLARGRYCDAVAGDLAESVRSGRSAWWYWRQVAGAIGLSWRSGLETRAGRVVFVAGWAAIYRTWHWQHFVMEPIFRPVLWWINHDVAIPYRRGVGVASGLVVESLILAAVFLVFWAMRGRGRREVAAARMVWGALAGLAFFAAAQWGLWWSAQALSLGYQDAVRASLRFLLFHSVTGPGQSTMLTSVWEPLLVADGVYWVIAWALPLEQRAETDGRKGAMA